MKIYFGRHKGEDIEDIPSDYLKWLAENCDDDEIATAADQEYSFRESMEVHFWGKDYLERMINECK